MESSFLGINVLPADTPMPSPTGQPAIEWLGIVIMEPMVTLTDLWITAVSLFAYIRLKRLDFQGRVHGYMRWYFLLMGIATFFGGLLGHGFQHVVGLEWKLPGWLISMLAVSAIERATILYVQPLISKRLTRFLEVANVVELLAFAALSFGTLDFFYIKVHSAYGLALVVLPLHVLAWWKTRNPGSRIIFLSVCFASIAAFTYTTRIGFHTWFNHLDVSHTVMAVSLWLFYRGALRLKVFTRDDLLSEPGTLGQALSEAVRPTRAGHAAGRVLAVLAAIGVATLPVVDPALAQTRGGDAIRVEPANWWVGMENPRFQVLLHADGVAAMEASVEHPGLRIMEQVRTANPDYLFLYMELSSDAAPGTATIRLSGGDLSGARRRGGRIRGDMTFAFPLWERDPGSAGRQGFDNSDVLLLVTPDRFANGDPSNDDLPGMLEASDRGYKGGRHGGDLAGLSRRLEYIDDMGYTAIWLNPVVENNMPAYSYHGYAATDFYRVDPRFGTNEQYRAFVAAARDRDIDVVMDMIMNHSGSEHWFVKDPPSPDWINFGGRYVNTSHVRQTVQDLYASEYDKRAFSDGWFVQTMPDLNQRNRLLADYLIQNTLWWIEYSGISGIRMDTYPYPDKAFMSDWTCAVMREYPDFSIVGEEWSVNPAIVSYWQRGKANHDGYESCLPTLMDFPLQAALTRALVEPENWNSGWITLYEMLANDFLYADPSILVTFPDNHDMDRFLTQVGGDLDLFRMGITFFLTMRGTPQIYYGTEILMNSDTLPGDHGVIRSDFPGGWEGDAVDGFTGRGLSPVQRETQQWMRRMLHWRATSRVVHEGRLMQFAPFDGIYTYFRYLEEENREPAMASESGGTGTLMVIYNKNEDPAQVETGRFREILPRQARVRDVVTGREFTVGEQLEVPGRSVMLLEIQP